MVTVYICIVYITIVHNCCIFLQTVAFINLFSVFCRKFWLCQDASTADLIQQRVSVWCTFISISVGILYFFNRLIFF